MFLRLQTSHKRLNALETYCLIQTSENHENEIESRFEIKATFIFLISFIVHEGFLYNIGSDLVRNNTFCWKYM